MDMPSEPLSRGHSLPSLMVTHSEPEHTSMELSSDSDSQKSILTKVLEKSYPKKHEVLDIMADMPTMPMMQVLEVHDEQAERIRIMEERVKAHDEKRSADYENMDIRNMNLRNAHKTGEGWSSKMQIAMAMMEVYKDSKDPTVLKRARELTEVMMEVYDDSKDPTKRARELAEET